MLKQGALSEAIKAEVQETSTLNVRARVMSLLRAAAAKNWSQICSHIALTIAEAYNSLTHPHALKPLLDSLTHVLTQTTLQSLQQHFRRLVNLFGLASYEP